MPNVECVSGYDYSKENMIFNSKFTQEDMDNFLVKNNYPLETENYDLDIMYDCSGEAILKYADYDKNKNLYNK